MRTYPQMCVCLLYTFTDINYTQASCTYNIPNSAGAEGIQSGNGTSSLVMTRPGLLWGATIVAHACRWLGSDSLRRLMKLLIRVMNCSVTVAKQPLMHIVSNTGQSCIALSSTANTATSSRNLPPNIKHVSPVQCASTLCMFTVKP